MGAIEQVEQKYYKRDFWADENLKYTEPHFRLEKSSHILNRIARGKECNLLDVGCGPAALMGLLNKNIHYHGIDIAIHNPSPNLIELDFAGNPIRFGNKKFDIILAQGVFEYIGSYQEQKFSEIKQSLKADGTFMVSYVNFDHVNKSLYWPYNNVQSFGEFRVSLEKFFRVKRIIPTSHHWHHQEPSRRIAKNIHMYMNVNIPLLSRLFAVEFFFICSPRAGKL